MLCGSYTGIERCALARVPGVQVQVVDGRQRAQTVEAHFEETARFEQRKI